MKALMKSYVWHGDKCFFVSTINRESSSQIGYGGWYAETLTWDYDYENRERGAVIGQEESSANSVHGHLRMCERLHKFGVCEEPDTDFQQEIFPSNLDALGKFGGVR